MGTDLRKGGGGGQAVLSAKLVGLSVFDELIGPADALNRSVNAEIAKCLQDSAAESACQDVIFQSENHIDAAREKFQSLKIERLGEARIDDRGADSFLFQFASDFFGHWDERAQSEDSNAVGFRALKNLRATYGDCLRRWLEGHSAAHATRIAYCDRTIVEHGGEKHVREFVLVLGNHVDNIGNAAKIA